MAAEIKLTTTFAKPYNIDFVNQFGQGLNTLIDILNVQRRIPMPVGSTIKTYKSSVTLDGEKVAKGDIIPLSEVKQEPADTIELEWAKHRKAVAAEDIQKYGKDQAISRTDDLLVRELQKDLRKKLFENLAKGTGKATGKGLQGALAQGWGSVQKVFEDDGAATIAFVNPMDIADYLENATVTIQNAFGLKYIEDFLGAGVVVISSLVPAKTVYTTAPDNLVLAYANMNNAELSMFDFYVEETGVIGVSHDIQMNRLTAETITASAIALFAERLDGVIVVTIKDEAVEAGK